ncbi:MAG: VTC domain-containing protein [Candidatus Cloacimonadales bacterium]|nr:VTC domain-containing protein [Candidatus Cloacimonadales bacterium]
MTGTDLTFKRKERKYIILEHTFDEIIKEIEQHIPLYSFQEEPPLTNIETTYLDTSDFLFYFEYLNQRSFRFKIRLRRYGHDGIFKPGYLVELKIKHKAISSKKRFLLPDENFAAFLKGEDILPQVKKANEGLVGAQKTYKMIRDLIRINQLVPVLRTSYERISFQKKSKRVRITVDHNINHTGLWGKEKKETLDATVLESKIMGKSPKWHKKMVNLLSLLRQSRFSKFSTGINSIYFPERGKYNFNVDNQFLRPEIPDKIVQSFDLLKKALKMKDELTPDTSQNDSDSDD